MSVIVEAPKCRNGRLKNHLSVVKDESVEWKDGVAEVSEATWEVLKGIEGYKKVDKITKKSEPIVDEISEVDKPAVVIPIDKTVEEVISENSENLESTIDEASVTETVEPEINETPDAVGKPVDMSNTVKEIRAFAKDNEIALGNAQSKKDLLKKIKKHFE